MAKILPLADLKTPTLWFAQSLFERLSGPDSLCRLRQTLRTRPQECYFMNILHSFRSRSMNSKDTMKAVIFTAYGAPEVLQMGEVKKPLCKDNEVLIKVYATSVTAGDTRIRSLNIPPMFRLPMRVIFGFRKPKITLGLELAGKIEAVGKDVTCFKPGDEIFAPTGLAGFAAYAQYKCLSQEVAMAIKPSKMSWEEAAVMPIGALTALHFLKQANIKPGQKVLICGASGSVGTYAVQIARRYGAEVTGVCSGANAGLVKSLGADHIIDYTKEEFTQNGETYDVIFDTVDKSSFSECIQSLSKNGFYLLGAAVKLSLFLRGAWVSMTTDKRVIVGEASENSEDLELIKKLYETGKLKPVIDKVYSIEQIVEAHRYVDSGRKKGNVAITVAK